MKGNKVDKELGVYEKKLGLEKGNISIKTIFHPKKILSNNKNRKNSFNEIVRSLEM